MKPLLLTAMMASGLLLSPQNKDRDKADALHQSGCLKRNKGDLEGAMKDFTEAVKLAPDVAGYWSDRAELWVRKKNYGQAIADYTRSIDQYLIDYKSKRMSTGLYLAMDRLGSRADCKFAKGDVDGALSDHTQAVELNPKHCVPLLRRAEFKIKLKNTDGAMADFNKAIEIVPDRDDCWEARGKARYALRNYDGALADYTKAIECNRAKVANSKYKIEENLDLRYQRACIQLDKGDYAGAIADFTEVIQVNPKHAYTWHNRAGAKRLKKDLDGAIADYSKAIEIDPKDAQHWHRRGACKLSKGDYPGSIADYTQAIELDPKDSTYWHWRGVCKFHKGDHPGSIADCSKAIEIDPTEAWYWAQRAEARDSGGDEAGAVADFAKAIELDPKGSALRHWRLGWIHYRGGRYADAQASLRRPVDYQNAAAPLLFLIGARLGNREAALKELAAHLEGRKGGSPDDWYAAIDSFLLGRTPEVDFLKLADSVDTQAVPTRKCMAFFYAGSLRLIDKQKDEATELFRKALDNRSGAPEFAAALAELKALGGAPKPSPPKE